MSVVEQRTRSGGIWGFPEPAQAVALVAVALAYGALLGAAPVAAIGLVVIAGSVLLAFRWPVAHLTLLLFMTAVVPYDVQNRYGFSGPGLVLSDVLLMTALLRAAIVLARTRVPRRQLLAAVALVAVLAMATLGAWRGVRSGAAVSTAGYELRALLGWGTLLVAIPLLAEPAARRRLWRGLAVVGLLLGLWGLIEYFANIPIIGGGSSGVRENINFTQGARSIQGGLFGFPVAFLLGLSAVGAGVQRKRAERVVLLAIVALNGAALLLTYQRTFWLATLVGLAFLLARAGPGNRLRAVLVLVVAAALVLPVLSLTSPGSLASVRQRFLSINQYGSDNSIRARVVESEAVVRAVREHPVAGSGLGVEVTFGYPWLGVPAFSTPYTHNAYLWLSWKLGILAAALLVALVAWTVLARRAPGLSTGDDAARRGAQACLLVTLVVSLTFPAFRALGLTTSLGLLVAVALMGTPSTPANGGPTRSRGAGSAQPRSRRVEPAGA